VGAADCLGLAAHIWDFTISGFDVLSLAVFKQHVDVARMLIAAGANVDASFR